MGTLMNVRLRSNWLVMQTISNFSDFERVLQVHTNILSAHMIWSNDVFPYSQPHIRLVPFELLKIQFLFRKILKYNLFTISVLVESYFSAKTMAVL